MDKVFSIDYEWIAIILTVIFVILKLTGVIAWSWVWVLCPLWICAIISLILLFIVVQIFKWIEEIINLMK